MACSSAQPQSQRGDNWFPFIRAPAHIRYGRETDFEPKLVSIGPYYRNREYLRPMEDTKLRFVRELYGETPPLSVPSTSQSQNFSNSRILQALMLAAPARTSEKENIHPLDALVDKFEQMGKEAEHCYKERFDFDFLRMLILDSCFVIRIMMYVSQEARESMAFPDLNIKEVRHDLLLMENQIPLFFIEGVYNWLLSNRDYRLPPFRAILEPFLFLDMSWPFNDTSLSHVRNEGSRSMWTPGRPPAARVAVHLLDLYWKCCLPAGVIPPTIKPNFNWIPKFLLPSIRNSSLFQERGMEHLLRDHPLLSNTEQRSWSEIHIRIDPSKVIPNATELNTTAGIGFEKLNIIDKYHRKGLHVNFSNGIMELPCLKIDPNQARLLANLIAFENSMPPEYQIFTSYVFLMDALIDSDKDAELLQRCGVINNTLPTHKMAAIFFNDIGNVCSTDSNGHLHSKFYNHVKKYYCSPFKRTRASLRHNYFNSLWGKISVAAGTVLLILTVLQTLFTILAYYYRH